MSISHFKIAKIKSGCDGTTTKAIRVRIDDLRAKPGACGHDNLKVFSCIGVRSEVNHLGRFSGQLIQREPSPIIEMPYFIRLDPVKQGSVGRPEQEKNGGRETARCAKA